MAPTTIPVNWISRDKNGELYRLFDIHLNTLTTGGVYLIYQIGLLGRPPIVLKVGQGIVADRFGAHRQLDVLKRRPGTVLATWAAVAPHLRDGAERFLADRYQPLYGYAFPDVPAVAVAPLPFAA